MYLNHLYFKLNYIFVLSFDIICLFKLLIFTWKCEIDERNKVIVHDEKMPCMKCLNLIIETHQQTFQ
jgi:hypothetical protein